MTELWGKAFEALANEPIHTCGNYLFVTTNNDVLGYLKKCTLTLKSDGDGLLDFRALQEEPAGKNRARKRTLKGRILKTIDTDIMTHTVRMYQVRIDKTGPWK